MNTTSCTPVQYVHTNHCPLWCIEVLSVIPSFNLPLTILKLGNICLQNRSGSILLQERRSNGIRLSIPSSHRVRSDPNPVWCRLNTLSQDMGIIHPNIRLKLEELYPATQPTLQQLDIRWAEYNWYGCNLKDHDTVKPFCTFNQTGIVHVECLNGFEVNNPCSLRSKIRKW